MMKFNLVLCAIAAAISLPATARDWRVAIGPQLKYQPDFPGSDQRSVRLGPVVEVHNVDERVRPETVDNARIDVWDEDAYEIGVAINVRSDRDADDLRDAGFWGLSEVDLSVELGVYALRRFGNFEIGVDVLQAVNGHDGLLIAPEIAYESDNDMPFRWRTGLAVTYADKDYMGSFFSTQDVRLNNNLVANYQAFSSLRDVSLRFASAFDLSDRWTILGLASMSRLLGDAKDSPITKAGSETEPMLAVGLAYSF
jgi:MipA family protein